MELDESVPPASLIDVRNKNGQTPLMMACFKMNFALVELLAESGADVNAVDEDGDSPITMLALSVKSGKISKDAPTLEYCPKIHKVE